VSAPTKITVEMVDGRIGQFRAVLDRTTGNLVALDADMTRQLLESSTSLRGATAASWADASRRHSDLWRGQLALESALARIAQVRGTKKSLPQATLLRLDELLGAACVQLPRSPDGAGAPLRLTDGPTPTLDLTIDDALDAMSKDYDVVAQVVTAVAEVWGEPSEQLRKLAEVMARLQGRLGQHGVRKSNEFQAVARAIEETEEAARNDPLGVDVAAVPGLEARLRRLETSVDGEVRGREERSQDLAAAEGAVRAGMEAVDSCRTQLTRGAEKVLVPDESWSALERVAQELRLLQRDVELARQPGADGPCRALVVRGEGLRRDVARLAGAAQAGIAKRDELRGVLTAYQAKAQAIGLAESLELAELHAEAHDALYSAPCDLVLAEQCLARFQHAVRPGPEAS
jgi:hypothetical protein